MSTFSLEKRLRAGINYLRCNPDPDMGYVPYFFGSLTNGIPYYEHSQWDLCDVGWRFIEAWHLTRRTLKIPISADEENLRTAIFGTIDEDGLSYRREEPWCPREAFMWDQGRALLALCTLAEGNDNRDWAISKAGDMLHALEKIALRDGEALWYPSENWIGDRWGDTVFAHPPTGLQLEGAVRYYNLTKDEWALEYAQKVAKGVLSRTPPLLDDEYNMVKCGGGTNLMYTHVHSRLFILYGLFLLGKAVNNDEYVEIAKKAYDKVLAHCTSYGWVPESMEQLEAGASGADEVCCIMDVVKYAAKNASVQKPEYYDRIERYVANNVAAHQILNYNRLQKYITHDTPPANTRQRNYDNILDRFIGSFTGPLNAHEFWLTFGDCNDVPFITPSGCCSPAGIVCYATAWECAITEDDRESSVNMHFSREGRNIDVTKASLTEGNITIAIKKPIDNLRIRVHEWADINSIEVLQNGKPVEYRLSNSYLSISNPAGTIDVKYPGAEYERKEPWHAGDLRSVWQGNIVTNILCDHPIRVPLYP